MGLALQFGKIQVFHLLIDSAIDLFTITLFVDSEVLFQHFAADAVSDAVLMEELS